MLIPVSAARAVAERMTIASGMPSAAAAALRSLIRVLVDQDFLGDGPTSEVTVPITARAYDSWPRKATIANPKAMRSKGSTAEAPAAQASPASM